MNEHSYQNYDYSLNNYVKSLTIRLLKQPGASFARTGFFPTAEAKSLFKFCLHRQPPFIFVTIVHFSHIRPTFLFFQGSFQGNQRKTFTGDKPH